MWRCDGVGSCHAGVCVGPVGAFTNGAGHWKTSGQLEQRLFHGSITQTPDDNRRYDHDCLTITALSMGPVHAERLPQPPQRRDDEHMRKVDGI